MAGPIGLVGTPSPRAGRGRTGSCCGGRPLVGRWVFGFRTEVVGARAAAARRGRATGRWLDRRRAAASDLGRPVRGGRQPARSSHGSSSSATAARSSGRAGAAGSSAGSAGSSRSGRAAGARRSTPHLAGAAAALEAGAVLCLFPETGPATPPGTARPLGLGVAYFALRTGAPIVPIVLGGTHELYRGRRFRMDVLPPVTARDLAGLPAGGAVPGPWSPRRAGGRPPHRGRLARADRRAGRGGPRGNRAAARHTQALALVDDRLALTGCGRRAGPGPGRPPVYSAAMQYAESILDLVGHTPLVRITRVIRDLGPARTAAARCSRSSRCSTPAGRSRTGSGCR